MLAPKLLKRMFKRNRIYTSIALAIAIILLFFDIYQFHAPSSLSLTLFSLSPILFTIIFSNLISLLFIDDRRSDLLEFLIAEGYSPKYLFSSYILAYLIIAIPFTAIISIIYLSIYHHLFYALIVFLIALGISWFSVPLSLYVSYFQRISPNGRSSVGSIIVLILFIIYLQLPSITPRIILASLIMGSTTTVIALILTITLTMSIKPDKLIS
ncbi:hypothetical protein [Acidianus manzaensis]|uniref:hypothetical protein n=1 Tax=Acidianus manzaensis TaxID=282676 RepID=UPI0011E5C6D7|nr:hypothetical protein [Acidianus manzaensis]